MNMTHLLLPALAADSVFDLGSSVETVIKWEGVIRWMESALPLLQKAASLIVIFWVSVLIPISIFRRTHSAIAATLRTSSLFVGFICCWQSFIVTYQLLGPLATAVGLLCAGVGVVPMALFATGTRQDWPLFGNILISLLLTLAPRVVAKILSSRSMRMPIVERGVRYYHDDYHL